MNPCRRPLLNPCRRPLLNPRAEPYLFVFIICSNTNNKQTALIVVFLAVYKLVTNIFTVGQL